MSERRTLSIVAVEALKFSSDEFANLVRADVERHLTRIVMIDQRLPALGVERRN